MVLGLITVKDRGRTPRNMQRWMTAAKRQAWAFAGETFHKDRRDVRFTPGFARTAGYAKRKPRYTFRKRRLWGHTNPLQWSGESRLRAKIAKIKATSKGVRIRYPGLRKFNFRNPNSKVRASAEFRTFTRRDRVVIARSMDKKLDQQFKQRS